MNDDFLYRLRKDPPPEFTARLKARLNMQASAFAWRFSTLRTVLFGLLIGASALAATLWVVKGEGEDYVHLSDPKQTTSANALPTNSFPPSAMDRRASNAMREEYASDTIELASIDAVSTFASDVQPSGAEENEPGSQAQLAPSSLLSANVGISGNQEERSSQARINVAAPPMTHHYVRRVAEIYKVEALEIESIDDDAALRPLCQGDAIRRPHIVLATRRMNDEENQACARSGIRNVIEAKIGYQGVVLTAAKTASLLYLSLSPQDMFLALAKQIPDPADPTRLIENTHRLWNQVNPRLEVRGIAIWGPAPKSALGMAVSQLIMEVGCDTYPWIKALKQTDPQEYRRICHTIREDGVYAVVEETGVLVTQKLWAEPNAVALLGVTFFNLHRDELIGNLLDGPEPTAENIESGAYPYARALHIHYLNRDRTRAVSRADWFFNLFLSGHVIGYLVIDGFIPLGEARYPIHAETLRIAERGSAAGRLSTHSLANRRNELGKTTK